MPQTLATLVGVGLFLAGCVAPEAPEPARAAQPVAAQPSSAAVHFDDAPVPNRGIVRGADDTVVRIAH